MKKYVFILVFVSVIVACAPSASQKDRPATVTPTPTVSPWPPSCKITYQHPLNWLMNLDCPVRLMVRATFNDTVVFEEEKNVTLDFGWSSRSGKYQVAFKNDPYYAFERLQKEVIQVTNKRVRDSLGVPSGNLFNATLVKGEFTDNGFPSIFSEWEITYALNITTNSASELNDSWDLSIRGHKDTTYFTYASKNGKVEIPLRT